MEMQIMFPESLNIVKTAILFRLFFMLNIIPAKFQWDFFVG